MCPQVPGIIPDNADMYISVPPSVHYLASSFSLCSNSSVAAACNQQFLHSTELHHELFTTYKYFQTMPLRGHFQMC